MAKRRVLPDQAYLQECFRYEPETGKLFWRYRPESHFLTNGAYKTWTANFAGKEAGGIYPSDQGYRRHMVGLNRKVHLTARIIFKLEYGYEPIEVDHKNCDPTDNRKANIRKATSAENRRNRKTPKNSSTKLKGVSWHRATNSYIAYIGSHGRKIHLGCFTTPEAAHEACRKAATELHGEFARTKR